jgi:alkanesulfonate monooxygenase SsuD/methylene tetrahydromethanopterin reductase-like flavin-dependent oxidoreductase (luciferase family)
MQWVMRCLVTRTDQPVDDPARPVAVGSWDQIREDVQKLEAAGVTETFFDVAFQPDVDDVTSYLRYMERFRAILEAPVAV